MNNPRQITEKEKLGAVTSYLNNKQLCKQKLINVQYEEGFFDGVTWEKEQQTKIIQCSICNAEVENQDTIICCKCKKRICSDCTENEVDGVVREDHCCKPCWEIMNKGENK